MEIEGWMSEPELFKLAEIASEHKIIVEIGCYKGRSTRVFGDNTSGIVFALDTWKGPLDASGKLLSDEESKNLLTEFRNNLSDLLGTAKVVLGNAYPEYSGFADCVFIDGDHSYEAVKKDIQTYLPKILKGGLLCGHDSSAPGVTQAVSELIPPLQIFPNTSIWYHSID